MKPWCAGMLLSDLYQRRMILLHDTLWRDVIIPAGTLGMLGLTQTRWNALNITFDKCPHCGLMLRKMIPWTDIDFAPGSQRGFF